MILTVADGIAPLDLQATLAKLLPTTTGLKALPTRDGAAVVVDASSGVSGRWLVTGWPVADPWGVPGRERSCSDTAAAFERYGAAAVQTVAGPFVAVDLDTGAVVRALNGIVPLYVSGHGRWVASTDAAVAGAVSGGPVTVVPAATSVLPDRSSASWAVPLAEEDFSGIPWAWAESVIDTRISSVGTALARDEALGKDVWSAPGACSMFLPRLAQLGHRGGGGLTEYRRLRNEVLPDLWSRSLVQGRWLCAPAFERPVLDTITMLTPRRATESVRP